MNAPHHHVALLVIPLRHPLPSVIHTITLRHLVSSYPPFLTHSLRLSRLHQLFFLS
jgi:hypothetical protein